MIIFKGIVKKEEGYSFFFVKFLKSNLFRIIESLFRRLLSTIIVKLIYRYPNLLNKKNKY